MIPNEAIPLDDWQRAERGERPRAVPKEVKPEPEPPVVADEITFADIPEGEIFEFSARGRTEKNAERQRFTGYTIYLETREGKVIEGWMPENEFQKLKQRIQSECSEFLQKIGL